MLDLIISSLDLDPTGLQEARPAVTPLDLVVTTDLHLLYRGLDLLGRQPGHLRPRSQEMYLDTILQL